MRYAPRIRVVADADVDAIVQYIAHESEPRAARFADAIQATFGPIAASPRMGAICSFVDHPELGEVRRRAVTGFPNYLAIYPIDETEVEIIRVLHGARDIPAILVQDLESDE